jgi:hypothetical protein
LVTKYYVLAVLSLTVALTGTACKGAHNRVTVQNEEPDTKASLASTIRMNDPNAGAQLLSGFYGVENNTWRWTSRNFSVLLRTPLTAGQRGAAVTLSFTVPDVVVQKLGRITMTAAIKGAPLASTDYETAGSYVFNADVPASMLTAESVRVDFALDKSLPPTGGDKRELGIVANSVGIGAR